MHMACGKWKLALVQRKCGTVKSFPNDCFMKDIEYLEVQKFWRVLKNFEEACRNVRNLKDLSKRILVIFWGIIESRDVKESAMKLTSEKYQAPRNIKKWN